MGERIDGDCELELRAQVAHLTAKLSECEKEVAILRNVHYRTDGCCTAAAELEAAQDRCRELEGELAELKKAALHVIDTLPPDIRADFHRGA